MAEEKDIENAGEDLDEFIDKKLTLSLQIYFLISIVLLVAIGYHVLTDNIALIIPLSSVCIGVMLGIVASRMFNIRWDHGAQKIISHFDIYGAIILTFYIIFEIYHRVIIERFVHGPAVAVVGLSVLSGVMIGRIAGIRGRIHQALHDDL